MENSEKQNLMKYEDFLALAEYTNENWKGSYTKEEVKENAECYYSDYLHSLDTNKMPDSIIFLLNNLKEDSQSGAEDERIQLWIDKMSI